MPPVELKNSENSATHVELATADQTFTAKDLGRGVIDTCSTGSISGTGTGTGIYIDLYRIPVLYRYNTCRNSENAFRIPTLIQRNLFQITNVLQLYYRECPRVGRPLRSRLMILGACSIF